MNQQPNPVPQQPSQSTALAPSVASMVFVAIVLILASIISGLCALGAVFGTNPVAEVCGYVSAVAGIMAFCGLAIYSKLHELHKVQVAQLAALERLEQANAQEVAILRKVLTNTAQGGRIVL